MHANGKAIEASMNTKNQGVGGGEASKVSSPTPSSFPIWVGVQISCNSILVFNDQIKIWENRRPWTVKSVPVWDCYYWMNTSLLYILYGSCCAQSIITSVQHVRLIFIHLVDLLKLWKAKFIPNIEVIIKWPSFHVDRSEWPQLFDGWVMLSTG